ncbi:hypothetical protein KFE96_12135 [Kordiimonas sp. SCSIO 12603]|uniref:XrtA system polysaccharide chain length determinant n=1 Tax=Kordiimonas sp. SCSIO 12603 TaxID=2829596 RepID=UPI00210551B3|nr:XrtA system polysaccharide chain length determinant [Kordiimonas sp. SCSIO 12603]UTW57586.1 hypothetical protein KFE96_12135 [Kordiimonas sp. SCSIO 12603]
MAAQGLGLHDVYQQIKAVAYGVWRKRWYMLVTAWVISLLGWGGVSTLPYNYEANARVFVNSETVLPAIADRLGIKIDVARRVDIIRRTLVTRPNLEGIVRRSDYLDRLVNNDGDRNALISDMMQSIRIVSLDGGIYRIQYENSDKRLTDRQRAEVVRNVVNELLNAFIQSRDETSVDNIDSARDLLQQSLRDYEERLSEADRIRAKFRQDNLEYLGQGNFVERLEKAQLGLRDTRRQISELRVAQQTILEQLKNVPPTLSQAASRGLRGGSDKSEHEERLADLRKKLDQLKSLGMKDRHPDVVNLTRQINAVKEEARKELETIENEIKASGKAGKKSTNRTEVPNRLYEDLTVQNINYLTQIRSLEQREVDQTSLVKEMEEKALRVPELEAELAQLERDYSTINRQYEELLSQKQDLDLQVEIEGADESLSFNILEEPVVPQSPVGPPRLLFLSFILVGGLVSGLATAIVLSQLRPVIVTVEQLRSHFDLPVLGNVSKTISEDESKKRSVELIGFAAAFLLLFVVFAVFVAFDIFGAPSVG